jgi:hypothetical protein
MKRLLLNVVVLTAALVATPCFAQLRAGPTRPQVPLPDGPVRNVILKNCVSCHGIDDYAFHAFTRERWESSLKDWHANQQVNALARADETILLDYLTENFGTEYTPFPRKYIPPEIDTYYGDPEGLAALDTICTECHELDRVYETRGSLERWRVLLLEMRARGAALPDDHDMERLAEWLSRVQSANLFE